VPLPPEYGFVRWNWSQDEHQFQSTTRMSFEVAADTLDAAFGD
jgi:hypothetical protein